MISSAVRTRDAITRIVPRMVLFFGFNRYRMKPGMIPNRMLAFYVNSTVSKISSLMLYFTLMYSKYLCK